MSSLLAIGDFARATHMTVKTLRHYHENGLLEPAEVDTETGYRTTFVAAERVSESRVPPAWRAFR